MKKKNKREEIVSRGTVMSAFVMLLVTAVALTTATYAWFTANQNVSIASLDVNVAASNGLQISVDGATWKSLIDDTDIKTRAYTGNKNMMPAQIVPVSSALGLTGEGKLQLFKGSVDESQATPRLASVAASEEVAGTTGDFMAFDIFVQVAQRTTLQLAADADVTAKADVQDKGLKNAARVCFVKQTTAPTGTAPADFVTTNGTGSSEKKLWEPNANVHSAAAVVHANTTYGQAINESSVVASYHGLNSAFVAGPELTTTDATYVSVVTPNIQTNSGRDDRTVNDLFTIDPGVTKIRVYCWVEGQDYDCENNASGTDISYKIKLTKVDAQAAG